MKPLRIASFEVYEDGKNIIGVANVDLPELTYLSETIRGAGVAGELDMPTLGQFASMEMTLSFTSILGDTKLLTSPGAKNIELWAAQQAYDETTGKDVVQRVIISTRCIPKQVPLGKFEVGASSESSAKFEVLRFRLEIDGEEQILIDKLNTVARFDGTDFLADVRRAIGK